MANFIDNIIRWKEVNAAAVTKAQGQVAGLQRTIAAVAPAAAAATGPMGQLATAGLSFGPAGLAIAGATGALLGFTAALGGALHMLRDAGEAAEQLENLSLKTGLAADDLQALKLAFKEAGVSEESLGSGLKFLNRAIGENAPELKALGITTRDAKEAFLQLSDAVAHTSDEAATTPVVMKLLGRAGTDLIPVMKKGGEELANFVDRAKETGAVLSGDTHKALLKVDEAFDQMDRTITILKNALLTALAPAFVAFTNFLVTSFITTLLTVSATMEGVAKALFALSAAFHVPIPAAAELMVASGRLSKLAVQMAKDFANVKTEAANKEIKDSTAAMRAAAAAAENATKANKELLSSIAGLATGEAEPRQPRGPMGQRETDVEKRAKAALALRQSLVELSRATDAELRALKGTTDESGKITVAAPKFGEDFDANVAVFTDGLRTMATEAGSSLTFLNSAFAGFSNGISTVFSRLTSRGQTFASALKTIFKSMVDEILAQLARLLAAQAFRLLLQILGIAIPGAGAVTAVAGGVAGGIAGGTGIGGSGPAGTPAQPFGAAPAGGGNTVIFRVDTLSADSFTDYMNTPMGKGYQSELRRALMSPAV